MKIIVRDGQEIKRCLVQLRDIDYLCVKANSASIRKLALRGIDASILQPESFVEIKDDKLRKIIDYDNGIADFSYYVQFDVVSIARMMHNMITPFIEGKKQKELEHKSEDLRDIGNYKTGILHYSILVLDGSELIYDDGEMIFGNSTIPEYYMLRSYDDNINLEEYVSNNVEGLFTRVNPEGVMKSYSVKKGNGFVLIHFEEKKKIFGKLFGKKKNN